MQRIMNSREFLEFTVLLYVCWPSWISVKAPVNLHDEGSSTDAYLKVNLT